MLELAPSIMILLIFVVFPFINLMGVVVGYATGFLITRQAARQAGAQAKFAEALTAMLNESGGITQSGLGRFVKLKPVGGYQNSGTDLYVLATNYITNQTKNYGPNSPVPPPIDSSTFVYEYTVPGTFDVGPLIDMSTVPFLGGIPGLGPSARIHTVSQCVVEHPDGLGNDAASDDQFRSLIPPWQPPGQSGGPGVALADSGWNYPNIYQLIQNAGQTIVDEDVLQVYANTPAWTDTGIDVVPGQKVWIDLRADGLWNASPNMTLTDADGDVALGPSQGTAVLPTSPWGTLVGRLGAGNPFSVGKYQLNLVPPGTGRLYLIFNDGYDPTSQLLTDFTDNSGFQTVRIIVTK